uniref:Uncharacterized protein n=1 Tax=Sphaerodactylus townsendi TaxID=933632 RepID=A0ACB8GG55_9SAUR
MSRFNSSTNPRSLAGMLTVIQQIIQFPHAAGKYANLKPRKATGQVSTKDAPATQRNPPVALGHYLRFIVHKAPGGFLFTEQDLLLAQHIFHSPASSSDSGCGTLRKPSLRGKPASEARLRLSPSSVRQNRQITTRGRRREETSPEASSELKGTAGAWKTLKDRAAGDKKYAKGNDESGLPAYELPA